MEVDDGRGIPVASSHYILSQCDELSAAGGVLGGMGVQRLMTLGNQSSSPLQMGTRGGRDLPTSRGDEDPSWRWEDPPPPGGGAVAILPLLLLSRIITSTEN